MCADVMPGCVLQTRREKAGQSSGFAMSRWSLWAGLWVAANKKAHLTHDCWDVFVHVLHENMGTF